MVLVDKREYAEIGYPSWEQQQFQQDKVPASRTKSRPGIRKKVMPVLVIMTGFAMASLIVMRYAKICETHTEILALEKTLEESYARQEELKIDLVSRGNLNRIEEYARDNLGMDYPEDNQVLFVDLPQQKNDYQGIEEIEAAKESEKSLWDKFLSLLD